MAAKVVVLGLDELIGACKEMRELIEKSPELVTMELARSMSKFVHVKTGYLKSTIYHRRNIAGADAPYAGYEADRGGSHDYASRAIEDFDIEKLADHLTEPF